MKYSYKEIIIPIAGLIAIVCLVYMENFWLAVSGLDPNAIAAIASAIIAGLIFITTVWQTWQNNRRNRLLVRPRLERFVEMRVDNSILHHKLSIINYGAGLAVVKKIELLFEGKVVSRNSYSSYDDFLAKAITDANGNLIGSIGYIPLNSIIKEGVSRLMWELQFDISKKDIASLERADLINKLQLRIEYQSIYEEETFICDTEESRRLASGEDTL